MCLRRKARSTCTLLPAICSANNGRASCGSPGQLLLGSAGRKARRTCALRPCCLQVYSAPLPCAAPALCPAPARAAAQRPAPAAPPLLVRLCCPGMPARDARGDGVSNFETNLGCLAACLHCSYFTPRPIVVAHAVSASGSMHSQRRACVSPLLPCCSTHHSFMLCRSVRKVV